jgi:putative endonuclease
MYLIFWERYEYAEHAIEREKEIKGWRREKKENLISVFQLFFTFILTIFAPSN